MGRALAVGRTLGALDAPPLTAESETMPIVCDLSMGEWRPRQLAREIQMQTGCPLFPDLPVPPPPGAAAKDAGSVISLGIGREASGRTEIEQVARDAAACALALLDADAMLQVIVCSHMEKQLSMESRLFLDLLRKHGVMVELEESESLPVMDGAEIDMESLYPGLVPASVAQANGWGIAQSTRLRSLASVAWMVPSQQRPDPEKVSRDTFDRFAVSQNLDRWVRGYAMSHCNAIFVDSQFLGDLAWQAFHQGSPELSLRLFGRALECEQHPLARDSIAALREGTLISGHRFAMAARAAQPHPSSAKRLHDFIDTCRAWGAAMSGDVAYAKAALAPLVGTMLEQDTWETPDLYLLNIYALCCFRSGEIDQAMALEDRIHAWHTSLPTTERDYALYHVNRLNTGRLHRVRKEHDAARRCFEDAFAPFRATASIWDLIHVEILRGQLCEAQGADPSANFLRAAVYYLSSEFPVAIPTRLAGTILAKPTGETDPIALCAQVSRALSTKLTDLFPETKDVRHRHLRCIRPDAITALSCHGNTMLSIFAGQGKGPPRLAEIADLERLSRVVGQIVGSIFDLPEHIGEIALAGEDGWGVASSAAELNAIAFAHEVSQVEWEKAHTMTERVPREQLLGDISLCLAPSVLAITAEGQRLAVQFYNQPAITLSGRTASLVSALQKHGQIRIGQMTDTCETKEEMFAMAQLLQSRKVVALSLLPGA